MMHYVQHGGKDSENEMGIYGGSSIQHWTVNDPIIGSLSFTYLFFWGGSCSTALTLVEIFGCYEMDESEVKTWRLSIESRLRSERGYVADKG
jgi:hypothetical protein